SKDILYCNKKAYDMKTKKTFLSFFAVILTIPTTAIMPWKITREKDSITNASQEPYIPNITQDYHLAFKSQPWKSKSETEKKLLNNRITMVHETLETFITSHFNDYRYTNYLSQNGDDLLLLLDIVKLNDLGQESLPLTYTILKLFNEKFKQCELIDDSVLYQILSKIPDTIKYLFKQQDASELIEPIIKKTFQNVLFETITTQTKSRPKEFCSILCDNITASLATKMIQLIEEHEEKMRIESLITRLIETITSKIMWNIYDYESFIPSLNKISFSLINISKQSIITYADDLDSLLWSLTARACYFLDTFGAKLSIDFFEELYDTLENNEIPYLELQEQDSFILTKKEIFTASIIKARTQAHAFRKFGIIS
ncbi:MAG TPA: hypothetical protein VJ201_04135, partial [Candidatus Babeliales bacterium]|nr:hypothetical protein [Candidatus Babeliales bacterium]